jgi:tetratricopeptide (TPR) repeat protein
MKTKSYDKTSRRYTFITFFGIAVLVFLVLISTAGTMQHIMPYELIKDANKALEINPQDENAWYNKGLSLVELKKPGEAIKAYYKAIEINPQIISLEQ